MPAAGLLTRSNRRPPGRKDLSEAWTSWTSGTSWKTYPTGSGRAGSWKLDTNESGEPGSAEARRALEFRPARIRTTNRPHGESPREGDFCRPGAAVPYGVARRIGQVRKRIPPESGHKALAAKETLHDSGDLVHRQWTVSEVGPRRDEDRLVVIGRIGRPVRTLHKRRVERDGYGR